MSEGITHEKMEKMRMLTHCTPGLKFKFAFCFVLICALFSPVFADAVKFPLEQARIVFVGDSITGQGGAWINAGYCLQMNAAITQAHPQSSPQIVALGGSGMGVIHWINTEGTSRTNEVMLDIKDVGVKTNLDVPADVLITMLGMNDVLSPHIGGEEKDIDQWIENYRKLVTTLRERIKPKVTGIATITPFTEDPKSFKNREIHRMNERLAILAKELDAVLLPTNQACWDVLQMGRELSPEFCITRDSIHPDPIGNTAVALAMLRALGDEQSARVLVDTKLTPALEQARKNNKIMLSYDIVQQEEPNTFLIHAWWLTKTGAATTVKPKIKLIAPQGWKVSPAEFEGTAGSFRVTGNPDRLRNIFRIIGSLGDEMRQCDLFIAAPWLIAPGFIQQWKQPGLTFDPAASVTAIDQAIEKSADFTVPIEIGQAKKLNWNLHFPSAYLSGGTDPGCVNYAAVAHGGTFESGYAARSIASERDRPVKLELFTRGVGTRLFLTAWLNGSVIYQNDLTNDPMHKTAGRVSVDANLKAGKNTLVIKSNHINWQWIFSANLVGLQGDALDDLRYATEFSK